MLRFCILATFALAINARSLEERLIGGWNTGISNFPYTVSLQYSNEHICGGTIIDNTHIITAATCVEGFDVRKLSIRAGTTVANNGGVEIALKTVVIHPDYNKDTFEYDVAIVTLEEDLVYSRCIKPIAITTNEPTSGSGMLTGWGTTNENGTFPSNILQKVEIDIVPREECKKRLPVRIGDSMICAGSALGDRDACRGDTGGPLVMNNELVGVVSFGIGCGRPNIPSVYANIAKLITPRGTFA